MGPKTLFRPLYYIGNPLCPSLEAQRSRICLLQLGSCDAALWTASLDEMPGNTLKSFPCSAGALENMRICQPEGNS